MLYAPVKSSTALTATIFMSKKVSKNTSQNHWLNLGAKISTQDICLVYTKLPAPASVQLQLQLQLPLELLLGATDHILFIKKNADLCQKHGNLMVGWVAAGAWLEPI